mgnify:CR=1 FL=1
MVQEVLKTLKGAIVSTQKETKEEFPHEISLYFNIIQEHSISLQSQITDHYIENNTAVQDQIAKSPLVVTLKGLVGEVVFEAPKSFYDKADSFIEDKFGFSVADKLGPIASLYPPVSNLNQVARNTVQYVEASVNRYKQIIGSAVDLFTGDQKETKLREVFRKLQVLRANDALLTIITPYTENDYPLANMAIQSITLRQGNENYVSDLEVTLKQLNFSDTGTTEPNTDVMSKYNATQRTEEANHGKAQGVETNNSILYNTFGGGRSYKTN